MSCECSNSSTSNNDNLVVVDKEQLDAALITAVNGNSHVKGGTLIYNTYNERKFEYHYGKDSYGDFIYTKENTSYGSTINSYYGYNANGKIYGINVDGNNKISAIASPNAKSILGPSINPILTSNYYYMDPEVTLVTTNYYYIAIIDYLYTNESNEFKFRNTTFYNTNNYLRDDFVECCQNYYN